MSFTDVFNGVIIPAIVAALSALVGFFFKILMQQHQKQSMSHKMQMQRAEQIHDLVIGKIDELFSVMKNQAIYIAFMKAKENKIKDIDVEKWERYGELLLDWKKNDVSYGAQIESYFCKTQQWTEVKNCKELFDVVNKNFDIISSKLWQLYHAHSEEKFIVLEEKTYRPSFYDVEEDWVKSEMGFSEFAEIESALLAMSQSMTTRIQCGNVGDLQTKSRFC